jgi:hypothetical protein
MHLFILAGCFLILMFPLFDGMYYLIKRVFKTNDLMLTRIRVHKVKCISDWFITDICEINHLNRAHPISNMKSSL